MIVTTSVTVTTTPAALISSNTTWADLTGAANITDPVPFSAFNDGVARIYLGGAGMTTATVSFPLLSSGTFTASLLKSDAVFAMTSAGATSTAVLMAGRQKGGARASDA